MIQVMRLQAICWPSVFLSLEIIQMLRRGEIVSSSVIISLFSGEVVLCLTDTNEFIS